MVDFRLEKFNNSVKKIVGDYLSKDFYNDGSTIISITDVTTSRDFAHAKILISIFTQDHSLTGNDESIGHSGWGLKRSVCYV